MSSNSHGLGHAGPEKLFDHIRIQWHPSQFPDFMSRFGLKTRVFNVGAYRRKVQGSEDADFFDAGNKAAVARREELAWTVLTEVLDWLRGGEGDVGIFDATNTTDQRRRLILDRCKSGSDESSCPTISVLFVESIYDDPVVLENNLQHKIISSPDLCAHGSGSGRFRQLPQEFNLIFSCSLF
jgi:hypothetical protein